jgi:hypothetical protein
VELRHPHLRTVRDSGGLGNLESLRRRLCMPGGRSVADAEPGRQTFYVVAEIYERGQLPEALARKILNVDYSIMLDYGLGDLEPNDEPLSGVIDSAAFSDVGTGKASRAETMNRLDCNWRPVEKGAGSVVAGLAAIHQALSLGKNGLPRLRIFRTCKNLIRTLPQLTYDPKNPETFDDGCESHAVDSLRYALTRRTRAAPRALTLCSHPQIKDRSDYPVSTVAMARSRNPGRFNAPIEANRTGTEMVCFNRSSCKRTSRRRRRYSCRASGR